MLRINGFRIPRSPSYGTTEILLYTHFEPHGAGAGGHQVSSHFSDKWFSLGLKSSNSWNFEIKNETVEIIAQFVGKSSDKNYLSEFVKVIEKLPSRFSTLEYFLWFH